LSGLQFEWHSEKAAENRRKHGVTFEEASTVFADPLAIRVDDPDHSKDEERYLLFGTSDRNRQLVVSYTERGEKVRVISARKLTKAEREDYHGKLGF
jgi:uncharacterized protein